MKHFAKTIKYPDEYNIIKINVYEYEGVDIKEDMKYIIFIDCGWGTFEEERIFEELRVYRDSIYSLYIVYPICADISDEEVRKNFRESAHKAVSVIASLFNKMKCKYTNEYCAFHIYD